MDSPQHSARVPGPADQIAEALPKEKQQRSVTDRSFPTIPPPGKQAASSTICC